MSTSIGNLQKLRAEYASPISYALAINDEKIALNPLLEKKLQLKFLNEIYCIQCQRKISKSFQQGYCYPCYQKLLDCNLCLIHPERCCFPDKPCPDNWAHTHCTAPHIVYIANSSDLKVGITRSTNIPTRWIDQGALQAIPFIAVSNRRQAGLLEVFLKQFIKDKTNWRQMLTKSFSDLDINAKKAQLKAAVFDYVEHLKIQFNDGSIEFIEEESIDIHYPIRELPSKLTTLALDKSPVEGILLGIKGQYLLFDTGVINIRKYGGYKIEFSIFS